jgi:hypothetical protein
MTEYAPKYLLRLVRLKFRFNILGSSLHTKTAPRYIYEITSVYNMLISTAVPVFYTARRLKMSNLLRTCG